MKFVLLYEKIYQGKTNKPKLRLLYAEIQARVGIRLNHTTWIIRPKIFNGIRLFSITL